MPPQQRWVEVNTEDLNILLSLITNVKNCQTWVPGLRDWIMRNLREKLKSQGESQKKDQSWHYNPKTPPHHQPQRTFREGLIQKKSVIFFCFFEWDLPLQLTVKIQCHKAWLSSFQTLTPEYPNMVYKDTQVCPDSLNQLLHLVKSVLTLQYLSTHLISQETPGCHKTLQWQEYPGCRESPDKLSNYWLPITYFQLPKTNCQETAAKKLCKSMLQHMILIRLVLTEYWSVWYEFWICGC